MVKHVILWQLKDEYDEKQKAEIRLGIKQGLEGLAGKIPGLVKIHVQTEFLPSTNADAMLECVMADEESLKNYSKHPAHLEVANGKVRPFTKSRLCMDYEIPED